MVVDIVVQNPALVRVVGFRMAGFMLSGSGIRVFVLGNVELGWGGWEKLNSMLGDGVGVVGMGCGEGLGWWDILSIRVLEVPQGCSCQVIILQCTLEGFKDVVGKYIRWKSVPLGFCAKLSMGLGLVVHGPSCPWAQLSIIHGAGPSCPWP